MLHSKVTILICIDFDCGFFIIDQQYLTFQRSNYVNYMLRKSESLKIKSIKLFTLNIDEYILINFVIFNEVNDKLTIACFIRHFYIVNNFKTNILFNNNIFDSKNVVVHINQQKFIINNCDNFSTSLKVIVKNNGDERIKQIIRLKINVTILIQFCFIIFIKYRDFKLSNRDILFNFNNIEKLNQKDNVFSHIINTNFFVV